jgi:hypothetical protein
MTKPLAFALTIALAVNALAQDSPWVAATELAKALPHHVGTVRYPDGKPAAGVQVKFYPGSYSLDDDYNFQEAITDTNGRYEILPPRKMSGIMFGPRLLTNSIMARDFEKNFAALQAFPVAVTNVDLTLQPAITLSGSVKNTEGAAVAGAEVGLGFEIARYAPEMRPPFKANEQGQFSIPALPQGIEYWIWEIIAKGYGSCYGVAKANDTQTNRYEFPAFVLKHTNRILAGQVLDNNDQPVAGAEVDFRGDGQPANFKTKTDSAGKFFTDAICEGELHVSAVLWTPFMSDGGGAGTLVKAGDTNVVLRIHPSK